jgi:hypothetical protein
VLHELRASCWPRGLGLAMGRAEDALRPDLCWKSYNPSGMNRNAQPVDSGQISPLGQPIQRNQRLSEGKKFTLSSIWTLISLPALRAPFYAMAWRGAEDAPTSATRTDAIW